MEKIKTRTADVSMTSAGGNGSIDHEIVASVRNWARVLAPCSIGDVGEHGERWDGPYGHRTRRRRSPEQSSTAALGGGAT